MGPYMRAALFIIRLAAAGSILLSLIYVGLEFLLIRTGKGDIDAWRLALRALPFAAGIVLWIKGRSIAKRLTRDFED